MTDEEKARERFVATHAVNLGKSQCIGCVHCDSDSLECMILKPKEAEPYAFNEKTCPHKEKK